MRRLLAMLAEFATPDAHIPRRWELKNALLRRAGLEIGPNAAIDTGFQWLRNAGRIVIEEEAVLGKDVRIYNFGDVRIGSFSMFAADITIASGGHRTDSLEPFSGPVSIGRGAWVGTGARIVGANITVGDNAIIGAGSLVIGDVPAAAIVAGVPAKVIGMRTLPAKAWHLGNRYFSPVDFRLVD
jgi:acetyltransferase-like isoleucine patch superfamily enzyme